MKSAWLVIAAVCLISTAYSSVKAQGSTSTAPSFTKKPTNTTARLYASVILQCEATGDPPPTTRWLGYFGNTETPISTGGRFIVGGIFGNLYIMGVRWEDAGLYGCVAQNQHGRITANASVTVVTDSPPMWHTKPYNVTLYKGQKYTIPCRTFGYPVPIHTWTRDGLLVVETGVRPLLTDLYFSKAKLSLAGWYTCSASNIQGSVSQSIYVHVVSDPSIVTQPLDMVTVRGATVTLSCGVVASERSLGVQWKKNDKDLPDDTRITTTRQTWHNTIWYTFKIKPARQRDLASYHCIVTNSKGSVTSNAATITFSGKPLALSVAVPQPNVITTEGLDVDLVCVFLGSPIPQVTWFKDGQNWDGVGFRVIKVTTFNRCEATLKLGNVNQSFAGNYVCRGDGVSSTVDGHISLTVRGASFPYVTPVESHVLALKDSNVTLQCILTGSAMPDEVTWYKDGEEVTNGSSAVHHPNGTYMALLNIASAQYNDTGLYKCTVQNQYGASSGNVTLSVKGIPAMPAIVRVNLTSDDVVIVSWVPGYDGGSDVMYYSVQFRMNSSTSWKSSKVPGNTTLILLTRPSEEGAWKGVYVFRVTAVNQYGPSEASKVQVTLGGDDKVELSVPEKRKDDDSLTGAVAGGVAGGVLLIILVIVLVLVRLRRKKRKSPPSPERQVYYSAVGEEPSYTEADGSSQGRSSTYSYVTVRPDAAAAMAAGGSEYASVPRQKHWEVPKRNVRLDKQLGSGHFGKVMKGFLKTKAGTKVVAVKMLKEKADEQQKKEFLAELELMKSIAPHPNIVGLVGCCSKSEQPYILVEFCTMGNLRDYLRSSHGSVVYANMAGNSLTLTCRDLMSFAWQSARGMSYLASQKLVHRDLAARNVLVDQSNVCKIADFGLARDIYEKKQYLKTGEAELPLRWMALESIFKGVTTTKSDVWSFGVLLWEIVTLGANPYPGMTREQLISQLHLGYRMPKPPFCTDELYSIMWQCWQEDPESRPSFLELGKTLHRLMTAERLSIDLDNFDVSYINAPEEE